MTSDINVSAATVVAIQGEAISTTAPSDGYVLTWNSSGDGYWEPKTTPVSGLRKEYFTFSTTWTCPDNVYVALAVGAGGGGGGSGGRSSDWTPGTGAAGSIQQTYPISVVPNTTYTITVGAGGTGGVGKSAGVSGNGGNGGNGSPTTISNGGITYFYALAGGGATFFTIGTFPGFPDWTDTAGTSISPMPGFGGISGTLFPNGMKNYIGGFAGGNVGSNSAGIAAGGAGGGGAGPQGAGGNGGNGSSGSGVNGTNGGSPAANTGAGGGGGGAGGNNVGAAGNSGDGGNGGSGYLYLIY